MAQWREDRAHRFRWVWIEGAACWTFAPHEARFALMHHVTLAEMKDRFVELADAVEAGETVVVTRDGRPILDLVPHRARTGLNLAALDAFKMERGIERVVLSIADDFDEPLPEDFLLTPLPLGQ
jgi:antitoxin (DNA-binding transcriptional repressor) of toxin-antitoxin stability system